MRDYDDDGPMDWKQHPAKYTWQICRRCDGHGKVDNPAFSNGISSEEFYHEWDEDDRENYLSGMYDVACTEPGCEGGKVKAPKPGVLTFAERRQIVREMRRRAWREESRREQERESRMLGEW